jgi:hypothetical protein
LVAGGLIVDVPEEHHAFEALEQFTMVTLVTARPIARTTKNMPTRLEIPLIPPKD